MGACTNLLTDIKNILTSGLMIKDDQGDPVLIAQEEGNLADIKAILDQFEFDQGTGTVLTNATFYDPISGYSAAVGTDNTHKALYVKSESLVGKSQFGEAIASPTQYTLLDRIDTLTDAVDAIELGGETISNSIISYENIVFGDNELSGAVGVIDDISVPLELKNIYVISFTNPSEETDIEIQLYLKETFHTNDATPQTHVEWCKHGDTFNITKGPDLVSPGGDESPSGKSVQVEGAFLAQGLGISAKLLDGTGGSGAFDLDIVIREK